MQGSTPPNNVREHSPQECRGALPPRMQGSTPPKNQRECLVPTWGGGAVGGGGGRGAGAKFGSEGGLTIQRP